MKRSIRGFVGASLFCVAALASDVSGQELIRYRHYSGNMEVSLRDGTATRRSHAGNVARCDLGPAQVARLRAAFAHATAVGASQTKPSKVSGWDRAKGQVFLDPFAPATRKVLEQLNPIQKTLRTALRETRIVSIAAQEEVELSYPTRTLTLRRRGKATLTYRLGERTWTLPRPKLSDRQRAAVRKAVRVFEATLPPKPEPRPEVPILNPWVGVTAEGSSGSREYHATLVGFLPPRVVKLGRVLEGILNTVYVYTERTLSGRVVGDRIHCGGLRVDVQGPLKRLLPKLQGQSVRFYALVRQDGSWAVALYLLAHDGEGGVLPVQGPGSKPNTLLSPSTFVRPSLPAGTRNLQHSDREWPAGDLKLTWSAVPATSSKKKKGIVSGLKEGWEKR